MIDLDASNLPVNKGLQWSFRMFLCVRLRIFFREVSLAGAPEFKGSGVSHMESDHKVHISAPVVPSHDVITLEGCDVRHTHV